MEAMILPPSTETARDGQGGVWFFCRKSPSTLPLSLSPRSVSLVDLGTFLFTFFSLELSFGVAAARNFCLIASFFFSSFSRKLKGL